MNESCNELTKIAPTPFVNICCCELDGVLNECADAVPVVVTTVVVVVAVTVAAVLVIIILLLLVVQFRFKFSFEFNLFELLLLVLLLSPTTAIFEVFAFKSYGKRILFVILLKNVADCGGDLNGAGGTTGEEACNVGIK